MPWIVIFAVCLLVLLALVLSAWSTRRLTAKMIRAEMERRRALSVLELRSEIATCDYFNLAVEGRSLRSTPVAKDFLRRLEAGEARDLLAELDTILTSLVEAERSIGYTGRPMLIDYDVYLREMLEELASRSEDAHPRSRP